MISREDRVELRKHLETWQRDRREHYGRGDVASLVADFEWMLDELDRRDVPRKPLVDRSVA